MVRLTRTVRFAINPSENGPGPADPNGYGRILRDADGAVTAIVEQRDATAEQRAITEINSGMYAFDGDLLADTVKRVPTDNAKGEEYLTDVVSLLRADGYPVATAACEDAEERGLAGAVPADEADALAGLHRERGAVEERQVAVVQLGVGEGEEGHRWCTDCLLKRYANGKELRVAG